MAARKGVARGAAGVAPEVAARAEGIGRPADPASSVPLAITAELAGRVALPGGPLALDALLGWAECARSGHPPALLVEDLRPVEIPVLEEGRKRFYLASFAVGRFEHFGRKWINRRFPLPEAQAMAEPKLRRILISAGPCKSYRIPLEAGHVEGDLLRWFAVGERDRVEELLALVRYLGKRRATGLGRVVRWTVEPVEPWEGFPVLSPEGKALRTLPLDWPGLVDPQVGYRVLRPPYWNRASEEPCAVPSWR